MKNRRRERISPRSSDSASVVDTALTAVLGVGVFASPLFAGKLSPIASLCIQLLVLVAAILWLVGSYRRGRIVLPGPYVIGSAALFFALLIFSLIDSVSINRSLHELANQGSYLLMFLMIAGMRGRRRAVYGILGVLALSSLAVGVIGLREYAMNRVAGISNWRTFSTFFNPDFLAGFMGIILPISLGWYLSETSRGVAILGYVWVVLTAGSVLVTGSRLGVASAAVGIAAFGLLAILSGGIRRVQVMRGVLLILPAVFVLFAFGEPLLARVRNMEAQAHSGGFRVYTWKGTIHMAKAHAINGTGIGTFDLGYGKYALVGYTNLAHNSYLQIAAEAGPASAVAFVLLVGFAAVPVALSVIRSKGTNDEKRKSASAGEWMPNGNLVICGLLGGTAASLARNTVDSDWYVTAIGLSFWVVLGAAVALAETSDGISARVSRRGLGWALAGIGAWAVVLVGMLVSDWYVDRGKVLLAEGDVYGAEYAYHVAAKANPLNSEAHRQLGWTYVARAYAEGDRSYVDLAVQELKTAAKQESTSGKTFYQLGRLYERFPDKGSAVWAFEKAVEKEPLNPRYLLFLARAYEDSGRYGEAVRIWKKMADVERSPYGRVRAMPEFVEPEYVFAHEALGRYYEQKGDLQSASKEYRGALKRIKEYQESLKSTREILEAAGRRDQEMENAIEDLRGDLLNRLNKPGVGSSGR